MLDNLKKYHIKLASNSPRRRELLAGLGIEFETKVLPGIDESSPDTLKGEEISLYIASKKADAYRTTLQPDELIITADTIVYLDGLVLGKPHDAADARRRAHGVHGAVPCGKNQRHCRHPRPDPGHCHMHSPSCPCI